MIRLVAFLIASFSMVIIIDASGDESNALVRLESKLQGAWKGDSPCSGDLDIKADGTFERRHHSPGDSRLTGNWKVKWESLPPTLVLTCTASDDADLVGKTDESKLVELNDNQFGLKYSGEFVSRYKRAN